MKDMAKTVADAAFSEAERQVIEKYYEMRGGKNDKAQSEQDDDESSEAQEDGKGKNKSKGKGKGKGKNKQKAMPKGIAMKLERGGTMPPGIARTRLPGDLEQQLPPPPEGFERVKSEGKVILQDIATGVIADIINLGKSALPGDKSISKTESVQETPTETKSNTVENQAEPVKSEKKWWQIWK